MTSSSVLRHEALHSHVHDGFRRSDHDFLIASRSNFLSGMHVYEITRFYCKPDMTSSWFLRQGALYAILHDGFWKSNHDFLIAFHSYFLSGMHVSEMTRFYCKPDVTSSWFLRQGALHAIFWLPILNGRPRFFISVALSHCAWNYLYPFGLCRCARKKGSKAGRKVTRSVYFTYVWSDP